MLIEIKQQIDKFPRMESHFCRAKTSKLYLHPDLSLSKMYTFFVEELEKQGRNHGVPSYATYRRVFKQQNLSFSSPKKDQCALCFTFHEGDESVKENLRERYNLHTAEKTAVRAKKAVCKSEAQENPYILCAVFDLQQVIYPISKESAIFYKSRLSTFNFTVYNIANKDCNCFFWDETASRRGSSEIATCIFKSLEEYSEKQKIVKANLFSDGCYGQNKNSIIAAMLMYVVNKFSALTEITLSYFETNHGQNEGDSAHSAISKAIATAGSIFMPSQLHPVIRLARKKSPYNVIPMTYKDFKALSKEIRILNVKISESGKRIKWTDIKEIQVRKTEPDKLFLKTSHLENTYDCIRLKRLLKNPLDFPVAALNKHPINISRKKFDDLVSLCRGNHPVVRIPECQQFIFNLPHEKNN
ncbi:uncharacterized protein [Onthophagus taurus]|uniref:uncharacterized protein isoform X1 n=1 Tax=Onthophagus taurus TaxID=166361 RepID=UPI0039BEB6A0